jgi:signal transduction histidine kinase
MRLWGGESDTGCCSVSDVDDARRVAQQIGIDHLVFNFSDDFNEQVVQPYIAAHAEGTTPNPCIECNRGLKFARLTERADALGFDAVATGHHARLVANSTGDMRVHRGADDAKDQSYVVHMLAGRELQRTLFPVGNMTKAEVTLNVDLGENIPKTFCYPGKLSQVFMNLVTNAVQATRIPGRQPIDRVINVRSYFNDNKICVEIQDNGKGIPTEIQDRIFEPFFTTKDVGEGTGLGLGIVSGIIGEHNGQLSFTTSATEGTTFLITLPIVN